MGGGVAELIALDVLLGLSRDILPPAVDIHCIAFGKCRYLNYFKAI
jgi:hypothetical protein